MARVKREREFHEAKGKQVESIKYQENADWQAIELIFADGTMYSIEFSAQVAVQASFLKARRGNLKMIRNYGRISADSDRKP
jgi:hypothetical protein